MAGAAALKDIADKMPDEVTPPPDEFPPVEPPPVGEAPIAIATGDPGPAGGTLLGKLKGTDDWIEAAPHDIGPFRMLGGEAENECKKYFVMVDGTKIDGWYLPSSGELEAIYNLYKAGKINCDGDASYWSSTRANSSGTYYMSVNFYTGLPAVYADLGNKYCVRPVRLVSEEEVRAFKKAQNEG
jgi:hypothetical protein